MASSLTNTNSVGEIQNFLQCAVCEKTINEPKLLSCSHSFCKGCIENLLKQSEDTKLNCPTCGATTTLKSDETVAVLPSNEIIVKLLTAVGPHLNQSIVLCSRCQKQPSITLCIECEVLLCHECYMQHESWPQLQSHTIQSMSEIINPDKLQEIGAEKLNCARHEDAIAKFYCDTCKELVCMKCMASVHTKPEHACLPIHEIYHKQQETVHTKCATMSAMLEEGNKVSSMQTSRQQVSNTCSRL